MNEDGFAVIFCADPGYRYERCEIDGREIRLAIDTKRAVNYVRMERWRSTKERRFIRRFFVSSSSLRPFS